MEPPRKLSPTSSRPGTPSPPPLGENGGVAQHKRLRSLQTELKKESSNKLLTVPEPTSPPVHTRRLHLPQRPPKLNVKLREQRDLFIDDEHKCDRNTELEQFLIAFCKSCTSSERTTENNITDLSLYLQERIPLFLQQYKS